MSENEKNKIMTLANMMKDEIDKLCETEDFWEARTAYNCLRDNIHHIMAMIFDAKFREL